MTAEDLNEYLKKLSPELLSVLAAAAIAEVAREYAIVWIRYNGENVCANLVSSFPKDN